MPDQPVSDLARIGAVLQRHGVEFMVVGGYAEHIFGSPRVTYDIDLCYRRSPDNLERLAAALKEIGVKLRGVPDDVPFVIDKQTLLLGSNFTFTTPLGDLDLLGWLDPIGDYEALLPASELHGHTGQQYRTIGLDDLIRIKRHINRSKDRESLMQLLTIKAVREQGPGQ